MSEEKSPIIAYAPQSAPPKETFTAATRVRLWCLLIGGIALSLLIVGWWLQPDAHGHGTHQQLGFPPCGMLMYTGIPCPTCGCTTAVSHIAHGHMLAGIITQPFGAAVGFLSWVTLAIAVISAILGRWIGPSAFFLQWHVKKLLIIGLLLLAGGWAYKIIAMKFGW